LVAIKLEFIYIYNVFAATLLKHVGILLLFKYLSR